MLAGFYRVSTPKTGTLRKNRFAWMNIQSNLETDMSNQRKNPPPPPTADKKKPEDKLERLARKIVPPSREIKDRDLTDPGRMTPDTPPVDNRS